MTQTAQQFKAGLEEFNRGAFFQAHETWEAVWHGAAEPDRDFYKGLIQVDVALYHHRHGNRKGAIRLMDSGMALLEPYVPSCRSIDLKQLLEDCRRAMRAMTYNAPVPTITIKEMHS
ncbi:MAG: DUF309 domain-containing protein [Desulfovibrionales bacterium]